MALVGSWPHIGPGRNGSGRTAHYRTFRTITAGRDDLEEMVEPSGGGGLLPGGVTTISVLHQPPTIVLHRSSMTYEGEGIEGRGSGVMLVRRSALSPERHSLSEPGPAVLFLRGRVLCVLALVIQPLGNLA